MALCVAWTVPARAGNAIGTVFYIAMENHNWTQPSSQTSPQQILGNAAAPYINSCEPTADRSAFSDS
jgi:hypothetical protein